MRLERFEQLVEEALLSLEPILSRVENLVVVVEPRPSPEQIGEFEEDGHHLYGLYEGIARTERDSSYHGVLPDKITIFKDALERDFPDPDELKRQIEITVKHEIAHHFGFTDAEMGPMGLD